MYRRHRGSSPRMPLDVDALILPIHHPKMRLIAIDASRTATADSHAR
jgi:hypothetical protein